jgi:hypothetical protein
MRKKEFTPGISAANSGHFHQGVKQCGRCQGISGGDNRAKIGFRRHMKQQDVIGQLSKLGFWLSGDGNHGCGQFAGSATKLIQFFRCPLWRSL